MRRFGVWLLVLAPLVFVGHQARSQDNDGATECGYFSPDADDANGPPIHFLARLSADEESAVTESPGAGHVDFTLDRKTLKFSWKLTYSGLTSPATGAHIRGPQTPGNEAGALYNLAPGGVKSGVEGSAVLNEGELKYLVQDRLYVNVLTTKYPAGEIRGQILRVRPECDADKKRS